MILTRESIPQNIARVLIWYPFRCFTRVLPLRSNFILFEKFGDLAFHLYAEKRELLQGRLGNVFPALEPFRVMAETKACFRTYYLDRFLINLVPSLDGRIIDQIAGLDGEEHLKTALGEGRGVVLLHAHFGPSQLPLICLGYKNYPVAQMGLRRMSGETIAQATGRIRLRLENLMPVKHFFADKYLRDVFRWLEGGRILMTAGDGTGGGEKIGRFHKGELLGRPIEMPLGPYRLASACGSPVLPIIALRQKRGRYRIQVYPPLEPAKPELMLAQFASWFGEHLAGAPGQWHFWDEWEPRPKGCR
jgi:phosphatidylinositol dimannoside acyltransferase